MKSRWWSLFLAVLTLAAASGVAAQSFPLTSAELADPAALPGTMRRLAGQVLAAYEEKDRRTELGRPRPPLEGPATWLYKEESKAPI